VALGKGFSQITELMTDLLLSRFCPPHGSSSGRKLGPAVVQIAALGRRRWDGDLRLLWRIGCNMCPLCARSGQPLIWFGLGTLIWAFLRMTILLANRIAGSQLLIAWLAMR